MKNEEIKKHIEVEGVILTPELIEYLKKNQSNNNAGLLWNREVLADAVCFIGKLFAEIGEENHSAATQAITSLSYIRDEIKLLEKP